MTRMNCALLIAIVVFVIPELALAQDPVYSTNLGRENCTFTSVGNNPYLPLTPGLVLKLEGDSLDDGETVHVELLFSVLGETKVVDGVRTRVVEEREFEDGEILEVSRNYMAACRETGAVWYFGEDVDIYEDGAIVSHDGAWLTGVDGAEPGIIMPGTPLIGARYYEELAPGVAEDRGEIAGFEDEVTVPAGTFEDVLVVIDTNALKPGEADEKLYAPGIGLIVDEDIELVEITQPACAPDDHTLCLSNGRFRVEVEWSAAPGVEAEDASMTQTSENSGEAWFSNPDYVELVVKVLDACGLEGFNNFWVFASGLTDRGVTMTVTDTKTNAQKVYESDALEGFESVLDTAAFQTCP